MSQPTQPLPVQAPILVPPPREMFRMPRIRVNHRNQPNPPRAMQVSNNLKVHRAVHKVKRLDSIVFLLKRVTNYSKLNNIFTSYIYIGICDYVLHELKFHEFYDFFCSRWHSSDSWSVGDRSRRICSGHGCSPETEGRWGDSSVRECREAGAEGRQSQGEQDHQTDEDHQGGTVGCLEEKLTI